MKKSLFFLIALNIVSINAAAEYYFVSTKLTKTQRYQQLFKGQVCTNCIEKFSLKSRHRPPKIRGDGEGQAYKW